MNLRRLPLPTVILILVPLLVLWPAVFGGKGISPWDQIAPMMGSAEQTSQRSWDILQADGALQFDVWRDLVFEGWRSRKATVWNPYQLAGSPLLANSQSAPFYPLHILVGVTGVSTPLGITLLAWFHLALAGIGISFLARQLGASEQGALLGGACFSVSPFMLAWTPLPSVITTCAWIPITIGLTIRLLQDCNLKDIGLLALATGMMVLGGHLQFVFYGFLAIILVIGWFAASQIRSKARQLKSFALVFAALILACLIGSIQVLPTLEYSKFSHRKTEATAEGYQAYAGSGIKSWELVGIVAPSLLGQPGGREADSPENFNVPTYWPMMVKPGGNYAESALFLCPPILLGLFMLRRNRDWKQVGAVALIATVGFLLTTGTVANALFYKFVPGFASTGSPGRAAILVVIAACVLAAIAMPRDDEKDAKAKAYPVIGLFVVAVIALAFANTLGSLESWIPGQTVSTAVAKRLVETVPLLLISLVLCAAGWFAWQKKGLSMAGAGCLFLAFLVTSQPFILPMGQEMPQPEGSPDFNTRRAYVNQSWDFFRPTAALMPPNLSTINRIQDIAGYDSLIHHDTVAMLREINRGNDPAPPVNGNMMFVKPDFELGALAEAGVTEIWSRQPLDQALTEPERRDRYFVYSVEGASVATIDGKAVRIKEFGPNFVKIATPNPGKLVARFRNLPGWTCYFNGVQTPIVGERWIELNVASGQTETKLTYTPPGLRLGSILAAIGILLAFGFIFVARRLRNTQPAESISPEEVVQ